jgi:hypothetical protein
MDFIIIVINMEKHSRVGRRDVYEGCGAGQGKKKGVLLKLCYICKEVGK